MIWCLKFKGQDCLPRGWSHVTTCIWRLVPLSSLERRRSWSSSPSCSCPPYDRAAFCQQSGIRSSQEDTAELNQPESCVACKEASDTSYTPELERREDPLIVTWSYRSSVSIELFLSTLPAVNPPVRGASRTQSSQTLRTWWVGGERRAVYLARWEEPDDPCQRTGVFRLERDTPLIWSDPRQDPHPPTTHQPGPRSQEILMIFI